MEKPTVYCMAWTNYWYFGRIHKIAIAMMQGKSTEQGQPRLCVFHAGRTYHSGKTKKSAVGSVVCIVESH
jgi:hypothetical protein